MNNSSIAVAESRNALREISNANGTAPAQNSPEKSEESATRAFFIRLGMLVGWAAWWGIFAHQIDIFAHGKDVGSGVGAVLHSVICGIPFFFGIPYLKKVCRPHGRAVEVVAILASVPVILAIDVPIVTAIMVHLGYFRISEFVPQCIWYFKNGLTIGAIPTAIGFFINYLKRQAEKSRLEAARAELTRQRAERLATNAQLASLESRVRPHFLFNALNTAMTLVKEAPDDAERALGQLSDLLRFTLRADPLQLLPLRDELTLVSNYLALEKERYGERLRYQISVDERAKTAPVFPFLVQTLVENCVKYAVAPSLRGAEILVDIRKEKKSICVWVRDDGPGFTEAAIREGHGLDNLRGRLEALYGDAARLQITPLANNAAGACVRIEFPNTDF